MAAPPAVIALPSTCVIESGKPIGLVSFASGKIVAVLPAAIAANVSSVAIGGTSATVIATVLAPDDKAPPVPVLPLSLVVTVSSAAPT